MRMKYLTLLVTALGFLAARAEAHVGSPDVFSEGKVGPYAARIVIRMPPVVPGRAEIDVRAEETAPLEITYLPLYARTAVKNAPPAEKAKAGANGVYRGELWLMSVGAYGIEVRLRGAKGEGAIQIPVNSVATHQLPLPGVLGGILGFLGIGLVLGVIAITRAAAAEGTVPPEAVMATRDRWRGRVAAVTATVVVILVLVGGWLWWNAEEREFRRRLRDRPWPDLSASVKMEGGQRMLHLVLGEKEFGPAAALPLIPDHGKLLHLFLVRAGMRDVFAHLHPKQTDGKEFVVALPPVPGGAYELYCDLTLSSSAMSSTAVAKVDVPDGLAEEGPAAGTDPDDSWAACTPEPGEVFHAGSGLQVVWKAHGALHPKENAGLEFEIKDANGNPVALQPYMGMMSHAAVLREDGAVFSHLHPSGNFSMAAQSYFQEKLRREAGGGEADEAPMDHSKMGHAMPDAAAPATISLPYEFPSAGNYRVWLQFKVAGEVKTAVFDAPVAEKPPAT